MKLYNYLRFKYGMNFTLKSFLEYIACIVTTLLFIATVVWAVYEHFEYQNVVAKANYWYNIATIREQKLASVLNGDKIAEIVRSDGKIKDSYYCSLSVLPFSVGVN